MRGMVFTELLELIEEKFGFDKLDEVIDAANLENDGAYTATGNYPFEELVKIVVSLSEQTNIPVPTLLEVYGEYLFPKLIKVIPSLADNTDVLKFVESVENYIHVQVRKLYPDAELPTFDVISSTEKELQFYYVSDKNIPQLAKGLIVGASKFFNQPIDIEFGETPEGKILFKVTKKD